MSYRTGHQTLALMMQTVADRNIPPSGGGYPVFRGATPAQRESEPMVTGPRLDGIRAVRSPSSQYADGFPVALDRTCG